MTTTGPEHVPVLLARTLELLAPAVEAPGAVLVDATLGLGGHSAALLERFGALRLVGLDRDPRAIAIAGERLAAYGERATLVHAVYDELADVLDRLGLARVQGVLFDLGVSSMQLDEADRGFAYAQDAPLDMRMDQSTGPTAAEVVNTYPAGRLARVLREYGEERFARRIADAVVRERARSPSPGRPGSPSWSGRRSPRRRGGPVDTRPSGPSRPCGSRSTASSTALAAALPVPVDALAVGGRMVVLSYHSLEDRMVKRVLTAGATSTAPPGLPVVLPEHEPLLRLLTRGSEPASEAEVTANPRAASVRLRAGERLRDAA